MGSAKQPGHAHLVRTEGKVPAQVSYLDAPVQQAIKQQVREVWERVSANLVLTQAGLASALQTSQSNVSRLLQSPKGHPWTPVRLKRMAQYLKVDPLRELIPRPYQHALSSFFEDYSADRSTDAAFLAECLNGIHRYFLEQGVNPPLANLQALAGKLYARLEGRQPTHEEMQKEIRTLVHEHAAGI
jgi:hypothetical protein